MGRALEGAPANTIKRYNTVSLALGIPGLVLQIVWLVFAQANPDTGSVLLEDLVLWVGTGLLIAGLSFYAIAKGRSGWWGLFGLLSWIGMLILGKLEDRAPEA